MGFGPTTYLIEQNLITAALADIPELPNGTNVFDSYGTERAHLPAIRFAVQDATETPANSGNFRVTVDIEVMSSANLETNFMAQVIEHLKIVGGVQYWIMNTLSESDMEVTDANSSATGFTNTLDVYHIRLDSMRNEVDTANSALIETFTVEVYVKFSE